MRSSRLEKEMYCNHQMNSEQTSRFETGYNVDYAFACFWFGVLSFMAFCFLMVTLEKRLEMEYYNICDNVVLCLGFTILIRFNMNWYIYFTL